MPNCSLIRDNHGEMHLTVADHYALGAKVIQIASNHEGGMVAVVHIPLKDVVFGEQSTVIPFKRRDE